jgi:hypothetical protein
MYEIFSPGSGSTPSAAGEKSGGVSGNFGVVCRFYLQFFRAAVDIGAQSSAAQGQVAGRAQTLAERKAP